MSPGVVETGMAHMGANMSHMGGHMGANMSHMGGHMGANMSHMGGHMMGGHAEGGHNTMDMGMSHGSGHAMFFSFTLPIRVLFFDWNIETQAQLIGSCIGVFLIAVFYEGFKVWRQYLLSCEKRKRSSTDKLSESSSSDEFRTENPSSFLSRMCNGMHLFQSILHVIQTTLGMFLMLIYMTFNVWLAIMVSLGAGFGYFLFAALIPTTPGFGDHCQ